MSKEVLQFQHIATLESSKVECAAYTSRNRVLVHESLDGVDPNRIHVFVSLKGGKLFEYTVSAEARNDQHTVGY